MYDNQKKEINIEVGINIKREREKAGLTQERFSEMVGLEVKSLSTVECGNVGISLTTLRKICKALSISSDAILFPNMQKNDTSDLTERLERLTPQQYEIAENMIRELLKAFALKDNEK